MDALEGAAGEAVDFRQLMIATFDAVNMETLTPLLLIDSQSFEKSGEWMPPGGVLGGAWRADGHIIAATGEKGLVRLWVAR